MWVAPISSRNALVVSASNLASIASIPMKKASSEQRSNAVLVNSGWFRRGSPLRTNIASKVPMAVASTPTSKVTGM